MSLLRARSGSLLRGYAGSTLRAFGPGIKTHIAAFTTDVIMTWEVDFFLLDISAGQGSTQATLVSTIPGTVIFHERMFHVLIWLMGSSNGRGQCDIQGIKMRTYSAGTPDTLNDTNDNNGLTLEAGGTALLFLGNPVRWVGDTIQDAVVDTGSKMEMYGEVVVPLTNSVVSIKGKYLFDPNVALGFPHEFGPVDWILAYFEPGSPFSVGIPIDRQAWMRVKVTVTA